MTKNGPEDLAQKGKTTPEHGSSRTRRIKALWQAFVLSASDREKGSFRTLKIVDILAILENAQSVEKTRSI